MHDQRHRDRSDTPAAVQGHRRRHDRRSASPIIRPKSVRHIVNAFMGFARWLAAQQLIDAVPKKPALEPPAERRLPVPDEEFVDRYLAAIPNSARGLFLVRSRDGLRPSEARRLHIEDYDFERRELTIRLTKTEKGKRRIPVDWETAEWIENWVPMDRRQ